MIATKKKRQSEYFKQKLITENIDILSKLPCAIEAVEEIGDMMIHGESKLDSEYKHAESIPNRKMINKDMLEYEQWENYGGGNPNEESTIAEHYDGKFKYFIWFKS